MNAAVVPVEPNEMIPLPVTILPTSTIFLADELEPEPSSQPASSTNPHKHNPWASHYHPSRRPGQLNFRVINGISGMLKLTTLVLGLITIPLTATANQHHSIHINFADMMLPNLYPATYPPMEKFYLAVVIICFILSFISVLGFLLHAFEYTEMMQRIDIFGHYAAGVLLVVGAVVWLWSVIARGLDNDGVHLSDRHYTGDERIVHRVIAGIFGLINGGVLIATSICICQAR